MKKKPLRLLGLLLALLLVTLAATSQPVNNGDGSTIPTAEAQTVPTAESQTMPTAVADPVGIIQTGGTVFIPLVTR